MVNESSIVMTHGSSATDSLSGVKAPAYGSTAKISHGFVTMKPEDLFDEANWLEHRARALQPQVGTEMVTTERDRAEFLEGARLLRLSKVYPQQLVIADTINAGLESTALCLPRRATKSTSTQAVFLGRLSLREDYRAAMTMTTKGAKARNTFISDVIGPIERLYPDPKTRPVQTLRGAARTGLIFPGSGSEYFAETPVGDSFRASAYDMVLVDESGEATIAQGDDLNGAILSTMDTRDGAQVVYAGTPGDYRDGNLLWDALHDQQGSVLHYTIGDDVPLEELATWESVEPLVWATHPGVAAGLTPIAKVEARYRKLGPERFAREYLGVFGNVGGAKTLVNPGKWAAAGTDAPLPSPPERFGLAYAMHAELPRASVVAAWRAEDGKGHIIQLQAFTTRAGIAEHLNTLWRKYSMPIAYDPHFGYARTVADALGRARPEPKLITATAGDVKTAAALLVRDVHEGNLTHYNQPGLNESAAVSTARAVGVGGFSFGRTLADDDPTPLEAAALALKAFDDQFLRPRTTLPPMFAE